ncbi:MAG: alpha-2-macroglobulin family protein, partial [Myxococcota bacterium]
MPIFALLATLVACFGSGTTPGHNSPPPEVLENGIASLIEASMSATLDGNDIVVRMPITKLTGLMISGDIGVTLRDLTDDEEPAIGTAVLGFRQVSTSQVHAVRVAGAGRDLTRAETGAIVIEWRVDMADGDLLYGKKSLYGALGRLEVQLRGPTEIPVGSDGPLRVITRHPTTLEPVAGADVRGLLLLEAADGTTTPVDLFSGTTDSRGELSAAVRLPPGVVEATVRVEVRHGDSQVWAEAKLTAVEAEKLYLSSDKTIYKPGQTVELRALALNPDTRAPLDNRQVSFEARDGKGNKVFKRSVVTDAFGVASISVPTDTRVNEGEWRFVAALDGTKRELRIPVERYNLPKMRLEVRTDAEYALPGEAITGTVEAMYLFGEPVVGATITLQATTVDGMVVDSISGMTSSTGTFDFVVAAPLGLDTERLADGKEALLLAATLTDAAGQVEEATAAHPLAAGPLVISALPESGVLVPNVANLIFVMVTDPLGRPLVADVAIDGLGTTATLQTDAAGVAELHLTPSGTTTSAELTISATDGAGRTHTRTVGLETESSDLIIVRTNKAVYDVGEIATVELLLAPDRQRVFLDLFKGAGVLESRSLDVTNGFATTQIEITDVMRGILVIDTFALAGSGSLVRGSRRLLVDPKDRLDISITSDATSYLPGGNAQLSVRVLDETGAPRVASVGLSVVNEASFVLGGEPIGDMRTFFHVDSRVLPADLSVLGRTTADLFRLPPSVERERLAQLLFAAGRALPGPGFDYNSIAVELPIVQSSLQAKVVRDAGRVLDLLVPSTETGLITWENVALFVEAAIERRVDAFGQLYAAEPGTYETMTVTSAGPDETMGTADDVSVEIWYSWIFWAYDWDGDGEFADDNMRGGGGFGGCDMCDFDAMPEAAADGAPPADPTAEKAAGSEGGSERRVRSDFRETVYFNPTLITDANGEATLTVGLAHSITTWRATAEASTTDGLLGAARAGFRTFQTFFVDFEAPTRLTRGDVIELSAVVYNYTGDAKTVNVALANEAWFTSLSSPSLQLSLNPSEVRAVHFSIRIDEAGAHSWTLSGDADGVFDSLQRDVRVVPDGEPEDISISDKLNGTREHTINVPADAIAGGTVVEVVVTPGFAGEAVQGTESLLKEPGGCFEQTTASSWPNALVTGYLEDTGQLTDELREKAVGLLIRGYQRLVTFESPTGGFNWWGNTDPGNRILSAIFLWQLKDLERFVEIDNADGGVQQRTLDWLLAQQNADGSWDGGDALHAGNEVLGTSNIRTTAFIAWALAHTGWADSAAGSAAAWLAGNLPSVDDVYANALSLNALAKIDPNSSAASQLYSRVDSLKDDRGNGQASWPTDAPSWTGAGGDTAALETTGLVAYGLMQANAYPENVASAMRFIIANKDSVGTWYNTQATMNALRALSAAASPQGSDAVGTFTVSLNGAPVATLVLTADNG